MKKDRRIATDGKSTIPARGRRIVNIINFIRAYEPRSSLDLVEPVQRQIETLNRHGLPATWLLQYDALIAGPYVALLKELPSDHEIGCWFEVVQPLVEKAGLSWRGRYPWDWRSHVGFSVGYTPAQREGLADVFMAEFKSAFGRYPASVGSWFMDAHLLGYLADRYGIAASCCCKDQWGTDGYTLWGGYWNQAYYPSRRNAFMPAQHVASQIPVPVFRMLGSDPIYQYTANLGPGINCAEVQAQEVATLEPCSRGSDPAWVRWFFRQLGDYPCLAFQYAQVGQENAMGWPSMKKGFVDQAALLADLRLAGQVEVETLAQSGRWFRDRFSVTPATASVALDDWQGAGRASIWYDSRFYRLNLLREGGHLRIRDMHRFDEQYAERYLNKVCSTAASTYDTLPVMDGFLWSSATQSAGIRFFDRSGSELALADGKPEVTEEGDDTLSVRWRLERQGRLTLHCHTEGLSILVEDGWSAEDWHVEMRWAESCHPPMESVSDQAIVFRHEGFEYALRCRCGRFERWDATAIRITPGSCGIVWSVH